MPSQNPEQGYNTNLASEYLMMSLLHRAGLDAYLSLGNKKGVDILVKTKNESLCRIEVKGVNDKNSPWPIGSKGEMPKAENLFFALVCYNSKIRDLETPAEFWLIPSKELPDFEVDKKGKTVYLLKTKIREKYVQFRNNFKALENYLNSN